MTGHLVEFFDVEAWVEKLTEVLADPQAQAPIREAARQHIIDRYDLKTVCLPRLMEFVTGVST